ncbi:hypothetical protein OH76DRAFT_1400570 [Lentinus brumalis]|uniref:Transmembrane protein n=1 Tax=Lentinus brumalis TaxID=2498619 RepID=A0A371DI70_9APHY|nr:hypothetical protein OH76DRAFT_1400570 [Polyporus brumalis]
MPVIQFGGAKVVLVDDIDSSVVYAGSWAHQHPSPGDHASTVSRTTVVGDTVNFTFKGTWVSVYGARSPAGTEKSTYVIDSGLPSQYIEESVAGLPKHKVQFFNSTVLPSGTHTLVTTNYGDTLLLDFFLVGLQDDDVSSGMFTQPQSSALPQPSQTTPAFTIKETISTSSSSSRAVPSGFSSQQLSSKLSKGASAGLAVGISVFCLLVGCGILAWYCLFYRRHRRARTEIVSAPAVVVTEYPSFSPSVEPTRRPDEKRERRFSDIGTSVFSLPPYGYTSHDPQVPTGSDIDDGLVPYNGLIDSKPPLPPMPLSPLRRESIPSAPPELSNAEVEKLQPEGVPTSTLAPLRGRWK